MAILTFEINVPTDQATRIRDSFCYFHGYEDTIKEYGDGGPNDIISTKPNPESKMSFVKKKLAQYIKQCVMGYEAEKDANDARDVKVEEVEALKIS